MREELVLDVPHRQVVFVIPRMLRVFFKYKRQLLSSLCQAAVQALLKYFQATTGTELRPGWGWAEMIRKVYEVDPLICPRCKGQMRIIALITDYPVVDLILNHLKLTFVASKPPPPRIATQEVLKAVETSAEYIS